MRRRPCSKRREGKNTFRRRRVESRIFSPHECEVALLLHNGAAMPVAGLALRGFLSRVCYGILHEVVRNASIVIETGLVRILNSAPMVTPTPCAMGPCCDSRDGRSLTHLLHVGLRQSVWTKIPEHQEICSSATGEFVLFGNFCQSACIGHNGLGVFHKFRCVHLQ